MADRQLRVAIAVLLALELIVGGGNLWATRSEIRSAQAQQRNEQAAQLRQGRLTERRLCTTLGHLAVLKPPPGDPLTNPSRRFDDRLHATLASLGPDLGCGG